MGWGGGSRGRSWVSWAAPARRRRRMRQTSTCSRVSLQIVGMDLWLGQLQPGSITQFPLQGSLPVLPCNIMEFYGIAGLLRGKTLPCSPCLNRSGIPGHRSVRMLMCSGRCGWRDPCRLDMLEEGLGLGMQLLGFDPGTPKQGDPTCSDCGAWGSPAWSLHSGRL